MVYWKAKHGILQAEKTCFAMKSDSIKSYNQKTHHSSHSSHKTLTGNCL